MEQVQRIVVSKVQPRKQGACRAHQLPFKLHVSRVAERFTKQCPIAATEVLKVSFFTLKNSDNVPARRFVPKAEKKDRAIGCLSDLGPDFYDICVFDKRKANASNGTNGFRSYTNHTRLDKNTLFRGWQKLSVKEIDFSEIMDEMAILSHCASIWFPNCF
jgi:hypothetical protein